MKGFKKAAMGGAIGMVLAGQCSATTLMTAPAHAAFADQDLHCVVLNVSNQELTVWVQAEDYNGAPIEGFGDPTLMSGHSFTSSEAAPGAAYCKFTFDGPRSAVRAAAVYRNNSGGDLSITVPAK